MARKARLKFRLKISQNQFEAREARFKCSIRNRLKFINCVGIKSLSKFKLVFFDSLEA